MGKTIVITSGKGGVGKSTITANLGAALALLGYKTLLIDTDIGLRNLDIILGMEDKIVYDIVDVCEGICDLRKAAIKHKTLENLMLVPAAQAKDKYAITPMQMKMVVDKARNDFDYILIDSPAGIEQGFENAIASADRAIVVATPEKTSIRDADRVIGLLEKNDMKIINLVINRMRSNLMNVEEILDILSVDLIGVIGDDIMLSKAANDGVACVLDDNHPSKAAFINIAKRITGEFVELIDFLKKKNVFVRIIDAIKN